MKILIIGELNENSLSSNTMEMIGKANELSTDVFVTTIGSVDSPNANVENATSNYIKVNENVLSTHEIANQLKVLIEENSIETIFAPSSYLGRDLAAFISVDYDSASVSNAVDISTDDGFTVITAINGGKEFYKTLINSEKKIVVIRPKSFEPPEIEISNINSNNVIELKASELDVNIDNVNIEPKSGPQLEDSPIVVSAGRGLGESDNLNIINELALKLSAAVGATRAIVDAGWVPYSMQVGQTGKTVKPEIYIACGISGATQHQVGMKDSKYIIAINKDEDAPIFQISDLGIVGDVHVVIPKLIELI